MLQLSTWCLTPVNLGDPLWRASSVLSQLHVRAYGYTDARLVAARYAADASAAELPKSPMSPWLDAGLVVIRKAVMGFLSEIDVRSVIDIDTMQVHPFPP
jgi:hypothetical protein